MPGRGWEVECQVCDWTSECATGSTHCRIHGGPCMRGPSQYVCSGCGRVSSVWSCATSPAEVADLICDADGGELVPWDGEAGHYGEESPHTMFPDLIMRAKVFQGPCGRCHGPVTAVASYLWD
jgi:hypothetical protein